MSMRRSGFAKAGMVLASFIGVVVTLGHYGPLPSADMVASGRLPPGEAWFFRQMPLYVQHFVMGALHVVPSLMFMALVPLQLSSRVRRSWPAIHRWSGRLFVVLGGLIGGSAMALGVVMPFGGWSEMLAGIIIGTGFWAALGLGVYHVRRGNIASHRLWMSRMLAFGFAPLTMRLFFVAGILMLDLDPQVIFGTCMLIGMVVNLVVVHWWMGEKPTPAGQNMSVATAQGATHG